MTWTPLVPFLARITLSVDERYIYFVPATFIPDWAIESVLPNLEIKPFSSSTVTCNDKNESQFGLRKHISHDYQGFENNVTTCFWNTCLF